MQRQLLTAFMDLINLKAVPLGTAFLKHTCTLFRRSGSLTPHVYIGRFCSYNKLYNPLILLCCNILKFTRKEDAGNEVF